MSAPPRASTSTLCPRRAPTRSPRGPPPWSRWRWARARWASPRRSRACLCCRDSRRRWAWPSRRTTPTSSAARSSPRAAARRSRAARGELRRGSPAARARPLAIAGALAKTDKELDAQISGAIDHLLALAGRRAATRATRPRRCGARWRGSSASATETRAEIDALRVANDADARGGGRSRCCRRTSWTRGARPRRPGQRQGDELGGQGARPSRGGGEKRARRGRRVRARHARRWRPWPRTRRPRRWRRRRRCARSGGEERGGAPKTERGGEGGGGGAERRAADARGRSRGAALAAERAAAAELAVSSARREIAELKRQLAESAEGPKGSSRASRATRRGSCARLWRRRSAAARAKSPPRFAIRAT